MTQNFWDGIWTKFEPFKLDPVILREKAHPIDKMFLGLIGEIKGKNILDLGCGK